MKRILALLAALCVIAAVFAGCGGKNTGAGTENGQSTVTSPSGEAVTDAAVTTAAITPGEPDYSFTEVQYEGETYRLPDLAAAYHSEIDDIYGYSDSYNGGALFGMRFEDGVILSGYAKNADSKEFDSYFAYWNYYTIDEYDTLKGDYKKIGELIAANGAVIGYVGRDTSNEDNLCYAVFDADKNEVLKIEGSMIGDKVATEDDVRNNWTFTKNGSTAITLDEAKTILRTYLDACPALYDCIDQELTSDYSSILLK